MSATVPAPLDQPLVDDGNAPSHAGVPSSATVLLVDDDPNLLRGVCRALHKQPFNLVTARSAEEALTIVKARPIAVIVSDERMPGKSGTELLAWIAKHCPEIVRIVLTGHTTPETTMRAVNEGRVFRFFSKPCNPLELGLALLDGIELHRAAVEPTPEPVAV